MGHSSCGTVTNRSLREAFVANQHAYNAKALFTIRNGEASTYPSSPFFRTALAVIKKGGKLWVTEVGVVAASVFYTST